MPYIRREERFNPNGELEVWAADTPGQLNYFITHYCNAYIKEHGGVSYERLNEVIGVLECAKQELYRRVVVPYEEDKRLENGDVYDV